jgi:hypothetical protein
MRRFIALIIMLVVPLQFAWAAAAGVYGHLGTEVVGTHVHEHEHHHGAGHFSHDLVQLGSTDDAQHNEDGHHGSHCHHVFSFILHQADSLPCLQLSGGPVQYAPAAFFSRIPPLLDRPPLARA